MVEVMMDHIATYLNKSPLDVRLANMDPDQNAKTIQYINQMKKWSDFESTVNKIEQYNKVKITASDEARQGFLMIICLTGESVDKEGHIAGTHDISIPLFI